MIGPHHSLKGILGSACGLRSRQCACLADFDHPGSRHVVVEDRPREAWFPVHGGHWIAGSAQQPRPQRPGTGRDMERSPDVIIQEPWVRSSEADQARKVQVGFRLQDISLELVAC